MKRRAQIVFTVSLVLADALALTAAYVAAYALRRWIPYPQPLRQEGISALHYVGMGLVHVVVLLVVFFFYRLYHRPRNLSVLDELGHLFSAVSVGVLVAVAVSSFLFKNSVLEFDYPRAMVVYAWVLSLIFVVIGRFLQARFQQFLQRRGWGQRRVLVVGDGEMGHAVVQKVRHSPELGYRLIGVVNGQPGGMVGGVPVIGQVDELPRLIDEHAIDEVIIAMPDAPHDELMRVIALCERGRVEIKVFPDLFQIVASRVGIGNLNGLPMITIGDVALRGWRLTLKRAVDLIGSAVGLVLLSPLMLLIALLIKLDSPGPVFYAQERMGLDGKPFWMLKFRSMRQDAEVNGPGWTRPDDPRRTRVGAWLRRTSLDELPQLINVLLGEMSLVGPRPERPVYVEQFRRSIPRYMERHREKAGMTGWAQIHGLRGDTSIAERTKYDLWYVENWSLWLDFRILLRTFLNIFSKDSNAY